ncbi:GNAT family N-acetyltransferase [archaeon]|nr:GNAT family N-acetyltransferase [archaeon]
MIEQLKLLTDSEEVRKVYEFIKQYPLGYPDYFVWLKKCRRQLKIREKKCFYASSRGHIIGCFIFQRHRKEPSVLEVKNFRVSEEHSRKGVGSALEIILCSYGRTNNFKRIRVDTHHNNFPMIQFLIKRGYTLEGEEKLYMPDTAEVILYKDL